MRIKPDFQRCQPIACGFSRDKKSAERFFANTKCSRRGEAEHPVVKRASEASPPPKFIESRRDVFTFFCFSFDCGWSLLNHGVADTKRLNLGNLNPIYERELIKLGGYQEVEGG